MDCSVPPSHKFSRKARVRESKPEGVHERVGKIREAYSSPPIKLSFARRERSPSFSPSKSRVRTSRRGGGDDISEVSSVSFELANDEAAEDTVASIIHEYKTARDIMRQSDNSAALAHRPKTSVSEPVFVCRSPGCTKAFRFAGDLYAHECRDHEHDGQPRAIRIPFDKTLHQKRASTANSTASRRRADVPEAPSGPRPPVPISRPRTAGVTVEVLQQGRKWEEGQLMQSWANHRATLDEYIRKLDRELGKTRDRLPMGPLALKVKRLSLLEDD